MRRLGIVRVVSFVFIVGIIFFSCIMPLYAADVVDVFYDSNFHGFSRDDLYVTDNISWWQTGNERLSVYIPYAKLIVLYDRSRGYFLTAAGTNVYVAVRPMKVLFIANMRSSTNLHGGAKIRLSNGSSWEVVESMSNYISYGSEVVMTQDIQSGAYRMFPSDGNYQVLVVPR